jgi:hypothetical protein
MKSTPVERVRECEDNGDSESTTSDTVRVPVTNTLDEDAFPTSKSASRSCTSLCRLEDNSHLDRGLPRSLATRPKSKWIAAHACFALFSAGLLLATIICHRASPLRGQEPWKSSGVAILHALEPDLQRDLRGIAKMSELRRRAGEHRVRLENGDEGWRLVSMGKEGDRWE